MHCPSPMVGLFVGICSSLGHFISLFSNSANSWKTSVWIFPY
jgi:hypothetical protein